MIRGRCPICSKSYEIRVGSTPCRPFHSATDRCRMIDLGPVDRPASMPFPGSAKDQKQQEEGDESSADDVE